MPNPLFLLWYARLDSNQRSPAPEAGALSPGLRAHILAIFVMDRDGEVKFE